MKAKNNSYNIYNIYHVKDTMTLNLFRVLTVGLSICRAIDMSDPAGHPEIPDKRIALWLSINIKKYILLHVVDDEISHLKKKELFKLLRACKTLSLYDII